MDSAAILQSLLLNETPPEWLNYASQNLDLLLIDQANCEKKAASSAISLLYRNEHDRSYVKQLSRLAREELRHFELVVDQLHRQNVTYARLGPSRYAKQLHGWIRTNNANDRFVDQLLVAAMIEARSCERIEKLLGILDQELEDLYLRLHESEGRHFMVYVEFALKQTTRDVVLERLASLRSSEAELISRPDPDFRFHSGIPKA